MRFDGKIKTWNDEKGFGFISPLSGGQDVFVHISEFKKTGRPQLGALLTFEVELNAQGKKRAVRVRGVVSGVPAHERQTQRPMRMSRSGSPSRGTLKTAVMLGLVGLLAWQGYMHYLKIATGRSGVTTEPALITSQPRAIQQPSISGSSFMCDGRQHCSQMTSCREAKDFLKNCPDMKMDGDRDGIPCEEQLCKGEGR